MPPILDTLTSQLTDTKGVMASAVVAFEGVAARIQQAHDQALAGGATAAELAPVQTLGDELAAQADVLARAIAANP